MSGPPAPDAAFTVTWAARLPHCDSDEAAGLAPGDATARTLAPSKEAFDAPLSPPPLNGEPGPATGLSGDYPDGTSTRRSGPVSRTQHGWRLDLVVACLTEARRHLESQCRLLCDEW